MPDFRSLVFVLFFNNVNNNSPCTKQHSLESLQKSLLQFCRKLFQLPCLLLFRILSPATKPSKFRDPFPNTPRSAFSIQTLELPPLTLIQSIRGYHHHDRLNNYHTPSNYNNTYTHANDRHSYREPHLYNQRVYVAQQSVSAPVHDSHGRREYRLICRFCEVMTPP